MVDDVGNILPEGTHRVSRAPNMDPHEGFQFQQDGVEIGVEQALTVSGYLNEVTTYVNTMYTVVEVNKAIQHTVEYPSML